MTPAAASASTAHVAAGPADCNSSFDPYQYSQTAVDACGYTTFSRLSTAALTGGGSTVQYNVHGATVRTFVPPAGFRPETASDAQLAEYGFPPRPADSTSLAAWQAEMSRWRGSAPPPPFLAESNTSADTEYSPNWAGYVIESLPQDITIFNHAEGWYVEPSLSSSRCSSNSVVTWAGLGGWNTSGGLAQNGSGINVPGLGAHQAWWEIVPGYAIVPVNFHAHAGYLFDASTRSLGTGYRFWFFDYYTDTSDAFDVSSTVSNTNSAEVVIERPKIGSSFSNLSNFGTLTVSESQANGNNFDSYSPNNNSLGWRHGIHMVSGTTGDDLADPSSISSPGTFTVKQNNCN
jgi:peptidase A4-like protein